MTCPSPVLLPRRLAAMADTSSRTQPSPVRLVLWLPRGLWQLQRLLAPLSLLPAVPPLLRPGASSEPPPNEQWPSPDLSEHLQPASPMRSAGQLQPSRCHGRFPGL